MDIVNEMLCDKKIVDCYDAIDKVNVTPSNHGMKHIFGVVKLSDEFGKVLGLTPREIEILKVCEILHDIGQVDGRENHGYKSMLFAKNYLPQKNYFTDEELELIYSCIETHDECKDYTKLTSKMAYIVNIVDKLDFSKTRLSDYAFERFGYSDYQDIDHIEFKIDGKDFNIFICLIENPQMATAERLLEKNLFAKGMRVFKIFCEHFGYIPKVWFKGKLMDLDSIKDDNIIAR